MSTAKALSLTCKHCANLGRYSLPDFFNSGWDAIFMYDIVENGTSDLLSINLSPEVGDGPRNSLSSPDGKRLYVVSPCMPKEAHNSD
jgi:hypothetical protein